MLSRLGWGSLDRSMGILERSGAYTALLGVHRLPIQEILEIILARTYILGPHPSEQ